MALIATLTDDFNGTTLAAQWTTANGATVAGGRGSVACSQNAGTAVFSAMRSAGTYSWQGSSLTVQAVKMPAVAGTDTANAQLWVMDTAPANTVDRLGFEYVAATNQLVLRGQSGAGYTAIGTDTTLTYSPTAHAWLRIAYTAAGSIVWSTSPDGLAWTVQRTYATPPTWAAKATLAASFEAFRSTGTDDALLVDNVNLMPTDGPAAGGRAGRVPDALTVAVAPNVAAADPAVSTGVSAGAVPDQLAIGVDPNRTLPDPTVPGGTRAGAQGDRLDLNLPEPATGTTAARSGAGASTERVTANQTGDALPGASRSTAVPDTLIRGVVLPDPYGAASRVAGPGAEGVGVTAVEPAATRQGHAEVGRPELVETTQGSTVGTLSNLPILRVLADFTAQAPAAPALAAGGTTVDITQGMAVTKVKVARGRQYELDQVEAGTASIEFQDKQGWLNPANTASPYNSGAASLQSYRPIRIRAVWQGAIFDLFSGFVERYPLTWKNAGFHEIAPMECVDHLGVLANIPIHQSYYDTVMADKPTVWIPLNDQAAPGSVAVSNPRALVANGASLPGNPRQGTSAFYQTSMLVGGTGVRMDASSSSGGQVSWGGDQMPDGTPAVSLTSSVSVQQGAQWQTSDARVRLGGGSFSLDTSGSTLEFWARMSDGDGRVYFASTQSSSDFFVDPDSWFGLFRLTDNNFALWVRLNAGGAQYTRACYASPENLRPAPADGLWHHYTISFVPNSDGVTSEVRFSIDAQFVTTTDLFIPSLRVAVNAAGAYTYTTSRLSATSAVSAFGMAYYSAPLTVAQIVAHYQRGVGYVRERPKNRYARLVNAYYPGVSLSDLIEVPETLDSDFNYGVFPVPGGANDGSDVTPYSVLEALQDIDTSTAGFTFVSSGGTLTAAGRRRRQLAVSSFTVGDRPELGEVPYVDIAYDYDNSRVISQTQLSRTNGDGGSITQINPGSPYFKNYSASASVYSGYDLFQLGMFLLRRYGSQSLRVRSVVIDPSANPALFGAILGVDMFTRVTVTRRTPTTTITGSYFVEHIEHEIDSVNSEWKVTLELSPAPSDLPAGRVDGAIQGVLGQTTMAVF